MTDTVVKPAEETDVSTRRFPPYNVILENDDHHTFDFVIGVLVKVLAVSVERAYQFAKAAHDSGRAIVWTGPKEVAELRVEQIQSFHQIREDGRKLGPLGVYIEPAVG